MSLLFLCVAAGITIGTLASVGYTVHPPQPEVVVHRITGVNASEHSFCGVRRSLGPHAHRPLQPVAYGLLPQYPDAQIVKRAQVLRDRWSRIIPGFQPIDGLGIVFDCCVAVGIPDRQAVLVGEDEHYYYTVTSLADYQYEGCFYYKLHCPAPGVAGPPIPHVVGLGNWLSRPDHYHGVMGVSRVAEAIVLQPGEWVVSTLGPDSFRHQHYYRRREVGKVSHLYPLVIAPTNSKQSIGAIDIARGANHTMALETLEGGPTPRPASPHDSEAPTLGGALDLQNRELARVRLERDNYQAQAEALRLSLASLEAEAEAKVVDVAMVCFREICTLKTRLRARLRSCHTIIENRVDQVKRLRIELMRERNSHNVTRRQRSAMVRMAATISGFIRSLSVEVNIYDDWRDTADWAHAPSPLPYLTCGEVVEPVIDRPSSPLLDLSGVGPNAYGTRHNQLWCSAAAMTPELRAEFGDHIEEWPDGDFRLFFKSITISRARRLSALVPGGTWCRADDTLDYQWVSRIA